MGVTGESPRITILGGFELRVGDVSIALQPSAERLVAFLALHPRPLQRAYVASVLWLDAPERRATASLRTALWRAKACGFDLVRATATHLLLGPHVGIDLRETVDLAHAVLDRDSAPDASRTADNGLALREAAAALLRAPGVLLPDWYEDWVAVERERYRQVRLHALERLCMQLAAAGSYAEAVEAGVAAVATEPLRESAHRALMMAHLEEGNAIEAIREYRTFSRMLRTELGLSPTPRMRALAERAVGRSSQAADDLPVTAAAIDR